MMKLLRRHKDWLMIVIAILAIPFIFYFVRTPDYGAMRQGDVGQIYGRKLTQLEIDGNARLGGLAQAVGMSEFWETLSLRQRGNAGYGTFAVNLIVLRHEAERLGLRPSASEIADVVRKLPAFQGESGFDIKKFTDFVRNALGPMGLGEEHIEQLVRDELSLNEIKKLVSAGISVSPGELDANFRRSYDKFSVSVVRFQAADFAKNVTVTDEDVQKYYDAHKAELKSDEKRKVQFVQVTLTDEQKKLAGKERIEALQKVSDRATDFTQALLGEGADFKQAAENFQLPVRETGEFAAATPDPQLKDNPQVVAASFKLSLQEPNSDPIQVADGFYILHLTGVAEARPLTVDEAKPKIVDALKKARAREQVSTKAAELVQQLRETTKSPGGAAVEAAVQKAGFKTEKLPPFQLIDEEAQESKGKEPKKIEPPDLPAIKNAVAFLDPGEVSDFSPSGENGFIAIVETREPFADPSAGEKKATFEKRLLEGKQRIVFVEWLHDRQEAAGLKFAKG
jgi:hypothetical protein